MKETMLAQMPSLKMKIEVHCIYLTLILFFLSAFSRLNARSLNEIDLSAMRKEFYASVNDKEVAERFCKRLQGQYRSSPLLLAYYGSVQAVMAKHSWNPYRKLSFVKNGLRDLGAAVEKSPQSLEIRFLRFSIEHYLPSFLGLSNHLEEDSKKILTLIEKNDFGTADYELVKNMVGFLRKTSRFTAKELEILNGALKNG